MEMSGRREFIKYTCSNKSPGFTINWLYGSNAANKIVLSTSVNRNIAGCTYRLLGSGNISD